jgi:glycosyltransferase involved in cell wall biosynthesis
MTGTAEPEPLAEPSLGNRVAIVVVPRDRFSTFQRCLDALYSNTDGRFRVIVVAGGVDETTTCYLERLRATKGNLSLVLEDGLLTQAEARNLGLSHLDERFVVVLENDVIVHENWLAPLLECMREEQAAVVTPLLWWYRGLHAAGGSFDLRNDGGGTAVLTHTINYSEIRRRRVDYPENHLVLIDRRQLTGFPFDDVEPFDVDLGLTLRERGLTVFLEPASTATYSAAPPLEVSDIPPFTLRWGWSTWNAANQRFQQKWGLRYDQSKKRASYRRQRLRFAVAARYPNRVTVGMTNQVFALTNRLQTLMTRRRSGQ